MDRKESRNVCIAVDRRSWRRFCEKAKEAGVTPTALLRLLVNAVAADQVSMIAVPLTGPPQLESTAI